MSSSGEDTGRERLLYMEEVAEITRLSLDTLRYMRYKGIGPPAFRLGRRVVYPESKLDVWIRQREQEDAGRRRGEEL